MAELNRNYNKIISELEERIKNPQELEFVKSKFSEMTVMFMDTIEKLVENSEKQIKLEKKVKHIQKSLKRIEEDLYIDNDEDDDCECEDCNCDDCDEEYCHGDQMHDNEMDYEFEIVCPYCNHEFVIGKETNLKDEIEMSTKNVGKKDYKTVLQEELQRNGNVDIKYNVIKTEGPDHDKTFVVEVVCNERRLAIGEGKSKKQAEMQAAKIAIERI